MADDIGLCTWIFGHQRHQDIAAVAADLGCAGVELHVPLNVWPAADWRSSASGHANGSPARVWVGLSHSLSLLRPIATRAWGSS